MQFCLDANILIEAKNRYYPFEVVPVFWDWIDAEVLAGRIITSERVYRELNVGTDDLAEWVKARKNSGLFIDPTPSVQSWFGQISSHVVDTYEQALAGYFLSGADPWVIALAKDAGAKVVTMETRVALSSKKVKIPNIAEHFGVPWCDTFNMMRELKAHFR